MAWDIETTDEFQAWWAELSEAEHEAITIGVTVLEEKGPALGRPRVDTLAKDSKHPNMKELRVQFAGRPYRICFAFDPRQTGILLIGGIKSGKNWTSKMVATADKIYDAYLAELKKGGTSLMARIKFNELAKQTMTPESIARSRKAAIKEIAAMELAELRDTLKVTQVDLAERMKVSQAAISKLEKRNRNIHVDQLRSIVSAMGGNLIIIADFDDRKVELSHIGRAGDSDVKKARGNRPRRA